MYHHILFVEVRRLSTGERARGFGERVDRYPIVVHGGPKCQENGKSSTRGMGQSWGDHPSGWGCTRAKTLPLPLLPTHRLDVRLDTDSGHDLLHEPIIPLGGVNVSHHHGP